MEKRGFLTSEAFSYGWETFKKNWQILLTVSVITSIIGALQYKLDDPNRNDAGGVLISLLFGILSIIVNIGVLKVALKIYDKEKVEALVIFRQTKYFWRYLGASILFGLIVMVGFILLIVPGIVWALQYSMTFNLLVDKDMRVMEAFKKSAEITNGFKMHLLLFGFACIGVIILGAIALGVGILVALPVVWMAGIYVYRHLMIGEVKNA